jgi:hypothetical protein
MEEEAAMRFDTPHVRHPAFTCRWIEAEQSGGGE